MVKPIRMLVLHCPAGGGHRAAANAIAETAARRGIDCEVHDALLLTPAWFAGAYVGAHLQSTEHAPEFYGRAYAALNRRRTIADGLRGAFDRTVGMQIRRLVRDRDPDAVLATHFFPLAVLGHARKTGKLKPPLVGVLTDYAAHAFWAEPGVDRFCAPAGDAARDLVKHGVSPDRIVPTGIPIAPAFGAVPPLRLPASGEPLRVLVTSGGFGVGPMLEVIRSFSSIGIPVTLTVVCGNNSERVEQAWRAAAESNITAKVIGLEHAMAERMAEAHVIVGKPGGLTVSESLAAGRPMVLVGACPGQEMSNQRWLVENGAAAVAAPAEAAGVVAALLRQGSLVKLAEAARALSAPDAADRVVNVAVKLWLDRGRLPNATLLGQAA